MIINKVIHGFSMETSKDLSLLLLVVKIEVHYDLQNRFI